MALPLWNSKTAHAALLCLHPNDGVSLGICGSGYSSNINRNICCNPVGLQVVCQQCVCVSFFSLVFLPARQYCQINLKVPASVFVGLQFSLGHLFFFYFSSYDASFVFAAGTSPRHFLARPLSLARNRHFSDFTLLKVQKNATFKHFWKIQFQ